MAAKAQKQNSDPALDEFVDHINTHVAPLFTKAMSPVIRWI